MLMLTEMDGDDDSDDDDDDGHGKHDARRSDLWECLQCLDMIIAKRWF